MEKVCAFLEECGTYFLATAEGDQPRVRPFGTILVYEDKLYIQTGKVKPVSHQLAANPKAEICAFKDGRWLRISGSLVNDDRVEVKTAMLEKYPSLRAMYSPEDDNTQVLYFLGAEAVFSSFTAAPETIRF
ncbi:MAG: pyridoxamine 5'-phosphate oxidase family protein [Clostridia bacterium]|nr:pyridoxamine 5'-phosphate oxidase family protein [Clostridia bacterium]